MGSKFGGGGVEIPETLEASQLATNAQALEMARDEQQRTWQKWGELYRGIDKIKGLVPGTMTQIGQSADTLGDLGNSLIQEGAGRRGDEVYLLNQLMGLPQQVGNIGTYASNALAPQIANLRNQAGGFQFNNSGFNNLAGNALNLSGVNALQNLSSQAGFNPYMGNQLNLAGQSGVSPFMGGQRSLANLATMSPYLTGQRNLANQARYAPFAGLQKQLGMSATDGINLLPMANATAFQGAQIGALANQTGEDLSPLRSASLNTLEQIARGEMPTAIDQLFDQSGVAERDILERQFQNAQSRLTETAGNRGGSLDRNLAGLEVNRALGIAQQEQNRADQKRALMRGLFGEATNQGLSALQQQAGLAGQAGSLFNAAGGQLLGAEQARQAGTGLAANIFGNLEGQRMAGLGMGANILGNLEGQRMAGLGMGANILGNLEGQRMAGLGMGSNIFSNVENQRLAGLGLGGQLQAQGEQFRQSGLGLGGQLMGQGEQLRQAGLSGMLGGLDSALQRDFQNAVFQQQALAQQQALGQSLAAQFGSNADALLMGAASPLTQSAALWQNQLALPALPAQILSGLPATSAGSFLSAATQGNSSLINSKLQADLANQQSGASSAAGTGQGIGTILGALIGSYWSQPELGAKIGGQAGSGVGSMFG